MKAVLVFLMLAALTVGLAVASVAAFSEAGKYPAVEPTVVATGTLGQGFDRVVDRPCLRCADVVRFMAPVMDPSGNSVFDGQGRQILVEDNPVAPAPGKVVEVYASPYGFAEYTVTQPPPIEADAVFGWQLLAFGLGIASISVFLSAVWLALRPTPQPYPSTHWSYVY